MLTDANRGEVVGRVTSQETSAPVLAEPFPTELAYDEEGRPLWLQDRRGRAAEMRYDSLGRLALLNH